MISTQEFRRALGQYAAKMSDIEIDKLNSLSEDLAKALFDHWRQAIRDRKLKDAKIKIN